MSLMNLLKKGGLRELATAAPATAATHPPLEAGTLATVATVAVANGPDGAANDAAKVLTSFNSAAENSTVPMNVSAEIAASPEPDPDRWCWPHSSAMNGREIDTMIERTSLFNRRGLAALEAELLSDKLVTRDRDGDDRRLCLECVQLSGRVGAVRCAQWQRAGLGAPGVPAGLVMVLQRCDGFKEQVQWGQRDEHGPV